MAAPAAFATRAGSRRIWRVGSRSARMPTRSPRSSRWRLPGYAFARVHHPFVDGNKQVAFYAVFATLRMNGWGLDAAERDAARVFDQIAAGEIDEATLAAWLERNSVPL